MRVKDVISFLNDWASPKLQEGYDNANLIVGNRENELTGILVSLDCIEEVVDEAIEKNCNMIVAHHPIVFSGLKSLTGRNYIERTIIKAIKNDIAIFAIHTNLDNIHTGVNAKLAEKIGLKNVKILSPRPASFKKISVFIPVDHLDHVREEMFKAGAGRIGDYDECSFSVEGVGSFRPLDESDPFVGVKGKKHFERECRLECLCHSWKINDIIKAMIEAHPYEEVAYDIYDLNNTDSNIGAGMIGEVDSIEVKEFMMKLKKDLNLKVIRHTELVSDSVSKIAICGGSGSFLLNDAMAQGADVFITGDFKYHQFFDADGKILIADIGHYESEYFTIELILEKLKEKFANFALHFTQVNTNPVKYL